MFLNSAMIQFGDTFPRLVAQDEEEDEEKLLEDDEDDENLEDTEDNPDGI